MAEYYFPALNVSIGGNTAGTPAVVAGGLLFLAGGNNITLSQNGQSITISGGGGGAGDGGNILAAGTQTAASTGTVLFQNSNGIIFGMSDSSVITASHNGLTSQSNQAISGSNGSFTFQTATFGSSNGLHFYTTNGSLVGSYTVPTVTNSSWTVSDNATSGSVARLAFTNLNGVTLSLSSGAGGSHTIVGSHNGLTSQSNQNVTAANGGFAFQTLSFSNAQGVSFATSAGNAIVASVETSYAASNHSHGNPTLALTNLSGTTASNSAGFTLSLSAAAPGGGAGFTKSRFNPFMEAVAVEGQIGQGTLHLHPVPDPDNFQFDRMIFDVRGTQATATNSSGSFTVSMWAGIYTRNASTLSLLASSSTTVGISVSGTVRSTLNNGPRILTMGWTTTITQNDLWIGVVSRTTSAGANLYTLSQYLASDVNSDFSGHLGVANNATNQNVLGLGTYSATTSAIPNSIGFNQLTGTGSIVQRVPLYYFLSQTA